MASKYETIVNLPSDGKLYGEGSGLDTVVLRAMTTQELKMIFGSGDDRMSAMLKACITDPIDFDVSGLIDADYMYLLIQLRIVTFGPEYKIETTCPHCGNINKSVINLSEDLLVNHLPDDFEEPIKIKLPISGDTVGCKLLRIRDTRMIQKLARKTTKDSKISANEALYQYGLAKRIVELNGEAIEFPEAQQYVQNMHAMDSVYITDKLDKIKVGYDMEVEIDSCAQCREVYDVALPIGSEFFRPTFD